MIKTLIICVIISVTFFLHSGYAQQMYPDEHWQQYKNPEDAGFSGKKLTELVQQFEQNGGAALLVIHNGIVLLSKGETARNFRQHSIRKSYLNALIGISVAEGNIALNATLEDLGIDDKSKLSKEEKSARIIDLMRSRSGIYHPAAFSPRNMENNLPERGSHKPGTFWFYNNWDFNALATIFNTATQEDLFETFEKKLALPLQFEDFQINNTHYLYEKDTSIHPAYLFRMSARDMARFGLLYLRNGKWKDTQIVPEDWVKESTRPYTTHLFGNDDQHYGYGLMWWTFENLEGEYMYGAFGAGGQRISIFPESNIVLVHLTNTYINRQISDDQINDLCRLLVLAKTGSHKPHPELLSFYPERSEIKEISILPELLKRYEGNYKNKFFGRFKIVSKDTYLLLEAGIGKFDLFSIADNIFINKDIQIPMEFKQETNGQKMLFESVTHEGEIEKFIFYY
jgi:CubicO group peptidase (beta-lactamase class C family)